jgi:hypothetical protein
MCVSGRAGVSVAVQADHDALEHVYNWSQGFNRTEQLPRLRLKPRLQNCPRTIQQN